VVTPLLAIAAGEKIGCGGLGIVEQGEIVQCVQRSRARGMMTYP
jgi:hypothetical protein